MDDNIAKLPVKFRHPVPEDRSLVRPWEIGRPEECGHLFCAYVVDATKNTVECGRCGADLNPMWVLSQLCNRDAQFHESARRYREETKRLAERSRTKCEWCDRMTRISRA
jgi:hypothetical protein